MSTSPSLVPSFIHSLRSKCSQGDSFYFPRTKFLPTARLPPYFLKLPFLDASFTTPSAHVILVPWRVLAATTEARLEYPRLCTIHWLQSSAAERICTVFPVEYLLGDQADNANSEPMPNVAYLSPALSHALHHPCEVAVCVSCKSYKEELQTLPIASSITLAPVYARDRLHDFPFPRHGSRRLSHAIQEQFKLSSVVHNGDLLPLQLTQKLSAEEDLEEDAFGGVMGRVVFMRVDKIVGANKEEILSSGMRVKMGETAIVRGDEVSESVSPSLWAYVSTTWGVRKRANDNRDNLLNVLGFTQGHGWIGNILVEGGKAALREIEQFVAPGLVILKVDGWEDELEIEEKVRIALHLGSQARANGGKRSKCASVLLIVRGWEFWQSRWQGKQGTSKRAGKGLENVLFDRDKLKTTSILAICGDLERVDEELRERFIHEIVWKDIVTERKRLSRAEEASKADKHRMLRQVSSQEIDSENSNVPVARHKEDKSREKGLAATQKSVSWDDIGGLSDVKQQIIEMVEFPIRYGGRFCSGISRRGGILLYGPPGTGKTLLARAVAHSCNTTFIGVKGPELLDSYVGESEKNVRRLFERARRQAPCVVFFDELDALAPVRGMGRDSAGVTDRVVSMLAGEIEAALSTGEIFVIGATNRPDLVDSGLMRPGRFDRRAFVPLPETRDAQKDILKALTRKFDLDSIDETQWETIVGSLPQPPSLSGADLYAVAADAWMIAARRATKLLSEKTLLTSSGDEPGLLVDEAIEQERRVMFEIERKRWNDCREPSQSKESNDVVRVTEHDLLEAAHAAKPSLGQHEIDSYYQLRRQLEDDT